MGNKIEVPSVENILENKQNLLRRTDSAQLDDIQLSSIMQNVFISSSLAPEIQINSESTETSSTKKQPPSTLKLEKKFSRSSGEVDDTKDLAPTSLESSSEIVSSISQSQSESALKSIVSPIGSATKDLVLSPFSKLAKGVQSIGANLDPRKYSGQVRYVSERDMEEHKKLQEKWQHTKTRLIAL